MDAQWTPLDAASDHRAKLWIQGKNLKNKRCMYTLPQGCLAKREIISDERKYVQNFLVQQFQTIFHGAARWGSDEKPKNLS
jgi:hypothetical protein